MPAQPSFPTATLESICQVLGAVDGGLTHQEIGRLLQQLGIDEPVPGLNKWKRLASALGHRQADDRCGNKVIEVILEALRPVRFTGRSELFEERRSALNGVLIFSGLELRPELNGLRDCLDIIIDAEIAYPTSQHHERQYFGSEEQLKFEAKGGHFPIQAERLPGIEWKGPGLFFPERGPEAGES